MESPAKSLKDVESLVAGESGLDGSQPISWAQMESSPNQSPALENRGLR